EPLVPRHVDHADRLGDALRREIEVREAELDGDAALLLLLQAVGVDAGERAHQRGLAVVDVSGGADDAAGFAHLSGIRTVSATTSPSSASEASSGAPRKRPPESASKSS